MPDLVGLFLQVSGPNPVMQGLVGGIVITLFNLLGAMAIVVWRHPSERALDVALGFAAGDLLFVISDEIIPETHARGHARLATLGTMIGLLVMLVLDVALG